MRYPKIDQRAFSSRLLLIYITPCWGNSRTIAVIMAD
jgi:hypothetical protein